MTVLFSWATRGDNLPEPDLSLRLNRRRFTRGLSLVAALVLALHLFWWVTDALDLPGEMLWRRLSNLDAENTFPTWLSALLLGIAAVLTWLVASTEKSSGGRYRRHWWWLSLILLGMSVDEVASFHEAAAGPVRHALGLSGAFYYGWVIPALIAVAVVAGLYARLIFGLPPRIKARLILAAALFVAGAVGLEMLSGLFAGTEARDGWPYFVTSTMEEILEIAGVILAIDTLLLYLEGRIGWIRVELGERSEWEAAGTTRAKSIQRV